MSFDLNAYLVSPDGSAEDINGKTIYFSYERFKDEICKKGHCFVCGAPPSESFNNEHVLPAWLLKHCLLHNETLVLPNRSRVKYSTYKIPCCASCNSQLADIYETPISKIICAGYDAVREYVINGGKNHLCSWLSLIFTKMHLRDFKNRVSLDERVSEGMIGERYDLRDLHHVHAVARAATADIQIDERVFGSLLILKLDSSKKEVAFNYGDTLVGRTMFLQVKDVGLIYVFDDCRATSRMLSEKLKILPHPIAGIQFLEVYAHLCAANVHIKDHPKFRTDFIGLNGLPRISCEVPELNFKEHDPRIFGHLLAEAVYSYKDELTVDGKTGDAALEIIARGRVSFILDEEGNLRDLHSD